MWFDWYGTPAYVTFITVLTVTRGGVGVGKTTRLALAGLSAIAVAYGFARYGYGLFVPVFREEFGLSTRAVGFVSSAGYASYLLAMVLTGFLVGRTGPRFPVVAGLLCAAAGMGLIATAQSPPPLVAGVVLAGSSPGFCWAPFSDAVAMLVEEGRRGRVLSAVSTGTTFGLAVAGPVVLLTGATGSPGNESGWRYAWAAFAAAALLVALWNARLLPGEPYRRASAGAEVGTGGLGIGRFLGRGSGPLLGQAFSYGLVAAFYYTYAVDLVRQSGFGEAWGPILWTLVGVAGVTGVIAGDAVSRFGLGRCLVVCLGVLALSIGALGIAGGSWLLVAVCAVAFGASYMPVAALLVLWSADVFRDRPAAGFSVVLFSLALGSVVGPAIFGVIAGIFDLRAAFWCAAALTALSIVLGPSSSIHGATHGASDNGSELVARADNDGE
jgi:predicted MFS family arabinose efflux permease